MEYDGYAFHRNTTDQGLLPSMSRMTEDIAGNLWIAGQTGLVRLDRRNLHTFNEADGLNSINVQAITEDTDGTLYFGNGEFYLSRLVGESLQTERPGLPASALYVWTSRYAFLDREGNWWILTKDKLYRFKKGNLRRPVHVYSVADGLKSDQMFQIFEDRAGNIWVSQQPIDNTELRGLSVLRPGQIKFQTFGEADGYPQGRSASSFVEDGAGRLWLGFYEGGMARFDGHRFTVFNEPAGVPKGLITDLLIDEKNRLWLTSSSGGVSRVDDLTADQPRFVNLNTGNGLSSNNVRTIVEDKLHNIYIGTVRGVDRILADGAQIKHYSVSDGLAGDFVVDSHCDRNGNLWFATTAGLSRLLPTANETPSAPPIWVGGLEVSGVRQPVYELGQTAIEQLDLNYRQNTLQIEFFSLDFRSGEEIRYQYKLDSGNQDWSEPTDQRAVTLANLQPGTYRFLVRAVDSTGAVSIVPAEIKFRISPPFWLRWWFRALVLLVIVGAVVLFYRYRIVRLRQVNSALQAANLAAEKLRKAKEERLAELERVRYRIATDLHDDIGASLTQIAILSEVAQQQNAHGNGAVAEPLNMIYSVSNELVGTMSDIVWAINPRKDHLFDLTQRMRRFASDVLSAKEIDFEFIAPPKTEGLTVGANVRREVFLIFKEAVNNIVKHSQATVVEIRFEISDDSLCLQLKDNGVGFTPPAPGTVSSADLFSDQRGGNGLISMRRRAAELGGEYALESQPGGGTSITLKLPVNLATESESATETAISAEA
jgi:signal transduction histidine kinase/streptogramin lyase